MPEAVPATPEAQPQLPLVPKVKGRFVIPDEPEVIAPSGRPETPEAAEPTPEVAQDTGTQATPTKSDGEVPAKELSPEELAERERKREGSRIGRRLDKAYRRAAEAEARAKLAEERLAKFNEPKPAPEVAGAPKLADFDYDPEKYAEAKAEFAKKQAEKEFTAKQQTEAQKKYRETLVSSWEEKVAAVEEKYDDFDEVVGQITPDLPFTAAIFEAENGADVAYYLGKHPKEAKRIAELSPLSQIREIGKLEAKLLAEPAKPKAPSKAPAPITPLTGAATPASAEPSEDDDTATWIKKRQKQVHSRR